MDFFKKIPSNTGMAFVVIQHLMPTAPSLTPGILSRITQMPVKEATDQERVLPNHVYTLGPNMRLTIENDCFQVSARTEGSARHKPFDRFLNSLAVNSGKLATAVVLSGYDGDGSEGFVAIKAHGGSTYAQDQTAIINEMPIHAMATGCVDHVLSPSQIAVMISRRH